MAPGPRCSACGRIVGMRRWLPPYRVELETWGLEFGDVMTAGDELVVSERFKDTYCAHLLAGLANFEPVEVVHVRRHRKKIGALPKYYKAEVVRSETTVDQVASGYEWDGAGAACPACLHREGTFLRHKRVVIKAETWTWHDIFHARGGVNFVASGRMKEACESSSIRNISWVPSHEFELDFYPSEAKLVLRYLRTWEDRTEDSTARQDAYRVLVFAIDKSRRRMPQGHFDPDKDIDPALIEAARIFAATAN
jgi:hypothetical protein